ncbi:hypothetical protein [Microcystis aeruginosa]|uniref:hypothetical protein n=1 Tax=Microcystis aeruginosa TaxID=1126 RepID=UPI00124F3F18|nr:hypothetical protein [Microcystis aeruginosa]
MVKKQFLHLLKDKFSHSRLTAIARCWNLGITFPGLQASPDAKVGTAKHENILIDELALFQLLFLSQSVHKSN